MIDRLEQIEALTKDRQRMLLEMDGLRARVEELEAEAAGVDAGIGSMAIVNDNLKARVSELERKLRLANGVNAAMKARIEELEAGNERWKYRYINVDAKLRNFQDLASGIVANGGPWAPKALACLQDQGATHGP